MKKFVLIAICSLAFAREDPFTPVIVPKDSIRPYYGETSVFDSAKIEFPSSARLIKKIEVTFQNIDGSIQTRSVAARGRIDWRMPLLISQVLNKNQIAKVKNADSKAQSQTPKTTKTPAKTMVKAVDIPSKETIVRESEDSAREMRISGGSLNSNVANATNATDSSENKIIVAQDSSDLGNSSDSNKDLTQNTQDKQEQVISKPRQIEADSAQDLTKKSQKTADSRKSANKSAQYFVDGNSIFIAYQGRLKRHYIMQNPYRIVLDFEINKKYYKKNSYSINAPYFKRLRYGLHTNFLRIVVELDGSYVYDLEKRKDGVKINVK